MMIIMEDKLYLKINESLNRLGTNNSEFEIKHDNETQDFILEEYMNDKKSVHLLVNM